MRRGIKKRMNDAEWREPTKHALAMCKTCHLPNRAEIERGFALGTHKGPTFQKKYKVSWSNARNHYFAHVSPEDRAIIFSDGRVSNAVAKVESEKIDVIETLKRLSKEAEGFLKRAKDSDDLRGGIMVIAELRKQVALAANLLMQQTGKNDIVLAESPAWQRVKATLMEVFEKHPAAKVDFLAKIGALAIDAPSR